MLELGSGLGIGGIAAALRGSHVTLTDTEDMVPALSANISANSEVCLAQLFSFADHTHELKQRWGLSTCVCMQTALWHDLLPFLFTVFDFWSI